jgi:hypothetical protein
MVAVGKAQPAAKTRASGGAVPILDQVARRLEALRAWGEREPALVASVAGAARGQGAPGPVLEA